MARIPVPPAVRAAHYPDMTFQTPSPTAAAAREAARAHDGKFGTQPAAEADLELTPAITGPDGMPGVDYEHPVSTDDFTVKLVGYTQDEHGDETEVSDVEISEATAEKIRTLLGAKPGAKVKLRHTNLNVGTDYTPDWSTTIEVSSGKLSREFGGYTAVADLANALNAAGRDDPAAVMARAREADGIAKYVVAQPAGSESPVIMHINNARGGDVYAATYRPGVSGRNVSPWREYSPSNVNKLAWVDDSPAARAAITPSLAWTDLSIRPTGWRDEARRQLHEQWLARQDGPVYVKRKETEDEREVRYQEWAQEMVAEGTVESVEHGLLNIRGWYVPREQLDRCLSQRVDENAAVPFDDLPAGVTPEMLPAARTMEEAEKWFHRRVNQPTQATDEHAEHLANRYLEQSPDTPRQDAVETMLVLLTEANQESPRYLEQLRPSYERRR